MPQHHTQCLKLMKEAKQRSLCSNKRASKKKCLYLQNVAIRNQLREYILVAVKDRAYTQVELADLLEISQPRVSNLLREHEITFSIDSLVNFLGKLGIKVSLNCS